jgi:hypothetical protein
LLADTDTITGSGESGCYTDYATQAGIARPLVQLLGVAQLFQKLSLTIGRPILGFDHIAARMNEERFPTRTGRSWYGVVVNRSSP